MYNVSESAGMVEICAVLIGMISSNNNLPVINIEVKNGTALDTSGEYVWHVCGVCMSMSIAWAIESSFMAAKP